jgi:branched-chain amino acid transport system permease protein
LNFGQVGFMAAGAYGTAIATATFGLPLPVGILIGLAAGVALALLLGAPTLRLRADYLAIVTIATGEIIRLVVRSTRYRETAGGSSGITAVSNTYQDSWNVLFTPDKTYGIRLFGRINLRFTGADLFEMITGWILVAVCVLLMWMLVSSPWGRVLKAIREDELAARALGKNVFRFRMQSLILGGTFGSIAGIFWAISQNSVQPDSFSTPVTFFALTAAIIGGLGRVMGPVVGSMIFWVILAFTDNLLREMVENDLLPKGLIDGVQVGQVRFILTGIGLMLLLIFRPQGVFGDKREIAIDVRR